MDLRSTSGALYLVKKDRVLGLECAELLQALSFRHYVDLPSSGDIVCVWWSRSDLTGKPKVSYFDQLWAHAEKILRFHVPVKKP